MRCIGLLSAPPERLTSQLPRKLDWTAADLLRATVATVLYGTTRSAYPGIDDEHLRVVMLAARDYEQEVGS